MLLLLQATREDAIVAVVSIVTILDLRNPGQKLNPEEEKDTSMARMGRSGTVTAGTFRCRDKGDGQEGKRNPHTPITLGQ